MIRAMTIEKSGDRDMGYIYRETSEYSRGDKVLAIGVDLLSVEPRSVEE